MSVDADSRQNGLIDAVRNVLINFVHELDDALDGDAQHVERILRDDEGLSRSDLQAEPEEWTEDVLIDELIRAVSLNIQPGRPNPRYETPEWVSVEIPDFELEEHDEDGDNGDLWIIGENKSVNKFEDAQGDMQEYLGKMWWPDYGIATDGITWGTYRIETSGAGDGGNGDVAEYYRSFSEVVDLRSAIRKIAEEEGVVAQRQLNGPDVDEELQKFVDVFAPTALVELLLRKAPKQLRDERKSDVDAFYELYIELLFGESEEYDDKYDSSLRNDIIQSDGRPDKDADVFAVELVDRLLFIKFLENRGVLDDRFLLDRINAYNEGLPNTLYKTVFDPLFYELLNTPVSDRPPHQQRGWQGNVPFLNGGLFRETVEDEREYDVENHTLETVISDLVEGTELEFEIDPAILGSVFEKTINHLSEKENRQKELGAFYTPDDVTRIVSRQSIQQKAHDEIIEAYAETVAQEEEFRDSVSDLELEEILSKIEAGASWFGRMDAMEKAHNRIKNLRVLDPACGSGHFLTAALDELHSVQLSLLRGQHGDDVTKEDRYDAKRELVLSSIYGVDVDPVAVQIARLRTWLTIVDEGWDDSFDELPNIELNIVDGNSLIGLPVQQTGQTTADVWDDRLDTLITLRRAYKGDEEIPEDVFQDLDEIDVESSSEVTREDVEEVLDALRPEFDEQYIRRLSHEFEDEITNRSAFDTVLDSISGDTLHPEITSIKIERENESELSSSDESLLEGIGCTVYTKSARLNTKSRHNTLTDNSSVSNAEARNQIVDNLRSLLNNGYEFTEVTRTPVASDHESISGDPFHWVAEFPEVVQSDDNGAGHRAVFDIIIGNPPYGDVLSDTEKYLVASYRTGDVSDIAAQFVERQLNLLESGGYYGNVLSLRLAYDKSEAPVRELLYEHLSDGRLACFAHRPSRVFEDAHVKPGIVTGQKTNDGDGDSILSSRFIRFDDSNRSDRISEIEYAATDGLVLGEDRIGSGENYSIPKLGTETARNIIKKLKEQSNLTFSDKISDTETDHLMWRRRGALYWINPMLTNLYEEQGKGTPTSMYKMYFDSDLDRRCAFIILQSSLYYHYWMVYKNGRNIDWWEINPFPFPDDETMQENADDIRNLSEELWGEMEDRFVGKSRTVFRDSAELKPVVDRVDELLGSLYDLSDDEVEYVQEYGTEYGRSP